MKSARSFPLPGFPPRFRSLRSFHGFASCRARAVVLLAGSSLLAAASGRAGTELDVDPSLASQTAIASAPNLANGSTYTTASDPTAAPPATTSDVTFQAGTYADALYNVNNSAVSIASLNVLTTTPITIGSQNTGATPAPITLNGGTNSVASVPANGGNAADLLYVAIGSSLTITGGNISLALAGAGNIDVGGTFVVGPTTSTTSPNIITGTGPLTKTGVGTMTIAAATNYTGGTTINGGTLQVGNAASVGTITGNITNNSALVFSTTATTQAFAGNLTGTGTVSKLGTGVQTLSGTGNTYSGTTTISAGTLEVATLASLPSASAISVAAGSSLALAVGGTSTNTSANVNALATFPNATYATGAYVGIDTTGGAFTYTGGLNGTAGGTAGALGLNKLGANTLTLSGTNTYTGPTLVSAGTLLASGAVGVLPTASAVNIAGGATISIRNDTAGTIAQGNGITTTSAGTVTIDVGNNGGATTGSTMALGRLAFGTTATSTAGTVNFTGANGYLVSLASLALTGGTGGTDTLTPTTTSVTVGNVSNQIATANNFYYDTLTLAGTSVGNAVTGTIANGLSATLVSKNGASVWTLSGNNSYTGTTAVSAGNLILTGTATAAATGAVNVTGTGTLLGTGRTPAGLLTVAAGANLAPGLPATTATAAVTMAARPGVLTTGALTLTGTGAGSNLNILLAENASTTGAGAGTIYSQVAPSGTSTLAGNLNLNINGTLTVGDRFFILQNTSATAATTGTFSNLASTMFTSGGYTFLINYADTAGTDAVANDVSLTVQTVPEPSTWALGLLGIGLLGFTQRRRTSAWLRQPRVS